MPGSILPGPAVEILPKYGEESIRLDPTANPPQYSRDENHVPSKPGLNTTGDLTSSIIKEIEVQSHSRAIAVAPGILPYQQRVRKYGKHPGPGSGPRTARQLKKKRWACLILVILMILAIALPLIILRTRRHNGSRYEPSLPHISIILIYIPIVSSMTPLSPAPLLLIQQATFNPNIRKDHIYLNFFQPFNGSLQKAMYIKEECKVFDAKLGTGIARIVKEKRFIRGHLPLLCDKGRHVARAAQVQWTWWVGYRHAGRGIMVKRDT